MAVKLLNGDRNDDDRDLPKTAKRVEKMWTNGRSGSEKAATAVDKKAGAALDNADETKSTKNNKNTRQSANNIEDMMNNISLVRRNVQNVPNRISVLHSLGFLFS